MKTLTLLALLISAAASAQQVTTYSGSATLAVDQVVTRTMTLKISGDAAAKMYQELQVPAEVSKSNPAVSYKLGNNVVCSTVFETDATCTLKLGFEGTAQ